MLGNGRMSDDKKNQGEGDRESARRYNDHLREFVVYGDPERAARDAADAVEGPEKARLDAAEARGKAPAKMSRLEQLRAIAHRVQRTVTDLVHELTERVQARRQAR